MNRHIEASIKTLGVSAIGFFFVYMLIHFPAQFFAFVVCASFVSIMASIYMSFLDGED